MQGSCSCINEMRLCGSAGTELISGSRGGCLARAGGHVLYLILDHLRPPRRGVGHNWACWAGVRGEIISG